MFSTLLVPPVLALLCLVGQASAQQVQCATFAGGCASGAQFESALHRAIFKFSSGSIYGGRQDTFASALADGALAQISLACSDGSVPSAMSGSQAQWL